MMAMDILAAPSRYGEGASLTIIQAMFASKPVVATDVGGNRELVTHNETGYIVPSNDIEKLTDSLGRFVKSAQRRDAMGAAGQQRALRYFTLDRIVPAFNELLWEVYKGVPADV